ncbi:MAG: hypothetical protein H7330_06395 [Hymenobacteraceae bacterium]|nr:hypothetical protein [Hymenobacteraceae bacterium]
MLLGSQQVFAAVPALVEELLGIAVSTSQVCRRCQAVGAALSPALIDTLAPVVAPTADAPLYAMVDGSMLPFEGGWQEIKLARVFSASALTWQMSASAYLAQRGPYAAFTARFERLLPPATSTGPHPVVFVTDGAPWIHHWTTTRYPLATHILDYYHVSEHLATAARTAGAPADWLAQQQQHLRAARSTHVEAAVTALPEAARKTLLGNLTTNRPRLRYDRFRARGRMIGSGPIEAAHRTVLQQRMKRSGQRWDSTGGDHLIRLRQVVCNQQFPAIVDLLRTPKAKV